MTTHKLHQLLPYQEIDSDCLVSRKGDITVAFQLTKPKLFGFSQAEILAQHELFAKAIGSFPSGTVFHFQEWFTGAVVNPLAGKGGLLSESSDRHFSGRQHFQNRS